MFVSANRPKDAPVICAYTVSEASNRAVRLEPVATIWVPTLLNPISPWRVTKPLMFAANTVVLNSVVPAAIPLANVNETAPTLSDRFTATVVLLEVYRTRTVDAETPPNAPNCAFNEVP